MLQLTSEKSSVIQSFGSLQLTAEKNNSRVEKRKETVLFIPAAYYNVRMLLHLINMQGMHETRDNTSNTHQKEVTSIEETRERDIFWKTPSHILSEKITKSGIVDIQKVNKK